MPSYTYTGTDAKGKTVKGQAHSATTHQLYRQMREQGIYVNTAEEIPEKKMEYYRLTAKEVADYARQIGTMQRTGIPIIKAVTLMLDQESLKPKLRAVYENIFKFISEGQALSDAMERCTGAFPPLIINMFRAGEASGTLDNTAIKMADYYTSESKLNIKIRNAMAYPTILAVMTVAITILMFTVILPQFFEIFEASGQELNILTKSVLGLSTLLVANWPTILCATILVVVLGRVILTRPAVKFWLDREMINLPTFGELLRVIYTSRFARTLSSLYSTGVPMLEAVEISSHTVGNSYVESQFEGVAIRIRGGQSLSQAMKDVQGVEQKLNTTIFIGEESGRLDEMLLATSEEYEFESDMAIERMLTYIEPIMIVFMALVIGIIVVAVMIPVMNMSSTIS